MITVTRRKFIIFLVLIGPLLVLQHMVQLARYPTKEEWFSIHAKWLADVRITPEMIAKAWSWKCHNTVCRLGIRRGIIPIGDTDGVYLVTHSFHDNEGRLKEFVQSHIIALTGRKPVEDAVLAIDKQGRFYTCDGHICGTLMLESKKPVRTFQDFLETYCAGDESKTWRPYRLQ